MISIEEAKNLVEKNAKVGCTQHLPLAESLGMILSEDVRSPIHMPPFDQSAMDGYAVCYDNNGHQSFTIIGEVKAGDTKPLNLSVGQAVRIFTGAPVPKGAHAVIMQEKTSVENQILSIQDDLKPLKNIRPKGEQIQQGEVALKKGAILNPAAIGFLATLGMTTVPVIQKPKITILVTGNELVAPGTPLKFGQIYESNAMMLHTALLSKGVDQVTLLKVKDDFESTKAQLKTAIENSDFVLVSGGISVGDYDFVGKSLLELGTKQVFYKVNQKPGKPLFYGVLNKTQIFALPGNPASALTCFYVYVETALQKFMGNPNDVKATTSYILASSYLKKEDRAEFLKGKIVNNQALILENQSSAMLNSFADADVLIYMPAGVSEFEKGMEVVTYAIHSS